MLMLVLPIAFTVLLIFSSHKFFKRQRGTAIPGPRAWPFIGNIPQLPKHNEWETYEKWAKQYGPIMSFSRGVLGSPIVIINSLDTARYLMNGRSANYAGRPSFVTSKLRGSDWQLTLLSGEPHRIRRAIVQRYYSGSAAKKHQSVQNQEAHDLLRVIASSPDDLFDHLKRFTANVVLLSAYGYRVIESSDPVLVKIEEGLHLTSKTLGLLGYLLNSFPILQYYPTWLPFSGFQHRLAAVKQLFLAYLRDEPFSQSKKLIAEGKALPCFVSTLLGEPIVDQTQENLIRDCAGVMYGAGVESTFASLSTFCLAALLYPAFFKKAQQEVDLVIGSNRLPVIQDREQLPFIGAVVLELLRWNVVTPLGISHRVSQDDVYAGLLVPAGATIAVNEWVILRDSAVFPRPETFDPDRYFGPGSERRRDVVSAVWGWGRRACPGRQLAEASLFITVASLVAVFDIKHAKDSNGQEMPVRDEFTSGFVRKPLPFKCAVTTRSRQARELIEASATTDKLI